MFPIDKGLTTIEASAGTGKTYTLCRIVLRLIAEKGIPIDRILAITFTQAATEELISRIRSLLNEAVIQLRSGEIEDPSLQQIVGAGGIDVAVALKRIQHSLEIFDEASISTIHGFCKRSLEFVSLESDIAFEPKLEPTDDDLVKRLQDEFVRINILEKSPLLSAFYADTAAYRKRLEIVGRECASHPYAFLEPRPPEIRIEDVDQAFDSFLESIPVFLESADALGPHLIKGRKFTRIVSDSEKRNALKRLSQRGYALLSDLPLLASLTQSSWKASLKKASGHLKTPVIVKRAEHALSEVDAVFSALATHYREWLSDNLRAEKERRNVVSFNDLLHLLNRALNDSRNGSIVQAINEQYDAALVDEFQDTDPTQFNIIQRLFGDGSKYLFLIGDPKQAIYRFRGADIFAYFKATESEVIKRIQLSDNYRSSPKLVNAVNALFANAPDGFAFERISFSPAKPALAPEIDLPLEIEAIGLNENTPLGSADAVNLLASRAAEDLAQRINQYPSLELGKIAFLVGTNREADVLMGQLGQRGIDCVLRAERSVFESDETKTMLQLLETLSHPSRASAVKALLLTPVGGYSWRDVLEPEFQEKATEVVDYLHDWSRNWRSLNFGAAFQRLLKLTGATQRMLGRLGGERQFTNLSQLSELLQSEALTRLSTPKHLFAWLHGKINESVANQESWQTRLTSDSGKPQIVTIHKSKGLEFPIVICPFLTLQQPRAKRDHALYHPSDSDSKLIIDLAPEEGSEAMKRAEREEYAEQLRLIYVALTRAVEECRIYLGPEENAPYHKHNPSAFCQLVLGSEKARELQKAKTLSRALLERIKEFDSNFINVHVRSLDEETSRSPTVVSRSDSKIDSIKARPIAKGSLPVSERILSFSTITRMAHAHDAEPEEIENDEIPVVPLPDSSLVADEPNANPTGPTVFDLPKGAHTGNLVHEILEQLDFQKPDSVSDCVQQAFKLLRYGYAEFKPVVITLIQAWLSKPLAKGLRLNGIAPSQRIPELEFAYPTSANTLHKIQQAFAKNPSPRIPSAWIEGLKLAHTRLAASMLRGFIDLTFEHEGQLYILDWKSNHLGNRIEDYGQESLEIAMSQHDYYLQYCLYSVAIKRYLEVRYPQKDYYDAFGGVFYLFLRGISDKGDSGIFFDRPDRKLLDALDEAIGK